MQAQHQLLHLAQWAFESYVVLGENLSSEVLQNQALRMVHMGDRQGLYRRGIFYLKASLNQPRINCALFQLR